MRGKILFVAGLATGYVLGSRAGRQRYEQIKSGWLAVWNTDPVQNRVEKAQAFAKARVSEVPGMLASGVQTVAGFIAHTTDSERDGSASSAPAAKAPAKKSTAKKPAKKPAASQSGSSKAASSGAKK